LFAAAGELVEEDEVCWADLELKYRGYLERERTHALRIADMDNLRLSSGLDYQGMLTLSYEARERLNKIRPASLGQASRLPGVTPSDIQCLIREVVRTRTVSRETT
jgi:tRNA uridine 5-carboxymethylaminomethyl modification enzyme